MTTVAQTAGKFHKRYPPPTARAFRHPWRWTKNTTVKLGLSISGTHIALAAFVAIYYIFFQSPAFNWLVQLFGYHGTMKEWWDGLFSQSIPILSPANWKVWRHFLRNGGEAYLASLTVLFFTFNPYTHKFKPIHSAGQVIGRSLLAVLGMVVVAVPIGLLLHGVQDWFHTGTLAPAVSANPNFAEKLYSDQWTTKFAVVLATVITRRLMYPVYAFTMGYFAEREVARSRHDHWFEPAPFRAMIRELHAAAGDSVERARRAALARGRSVTVLMVGGLLVTLALAGYGYYILLYIA